MTIPPLAYPNMANATASNPKCSVAVGDQGPGDKPSCLVVVPDSGGHRQDALGDPDRDAFARAATLGIPARVAEPWPGHDKAAAALTHPGGYIWRASDQPSGDDAITALTTAGVRFGSSAPEPLAGETVLLAA